MLFSFAVPGGEAGRGFGSSKRNGLPGISMPVPQLFLGDVRPLSYAKIWRPGGLTGTFMHRTGHRHKRQPFRHFTPCNMKADKKHVKIMVHGNADQAKNYVFEAYRLAVRYNITGYVKRHDAQLIEIVARGTPEATGTFVNQLEALGHDRIRTEITTHGSTIVYDEFRILTVNKKNSNRNT